MTSMRSEPDTSDTSEGVPSQYQRHDGLARGIVRFLAIGRIDPESESLFAFRRIWIIPAWAQIASVVGLFVATVLLTYAEFRESGTVFGFPGPAFNVLFVPIYEELIFRGWILGALIKRHSSLTAIAVSSLLFGILHIRNIYWRETDELIRMMVYTGLVIGPVLGYVTLRTRSVWPAVILHYINNLCYYVR